MASKSTATNVVPYVATAPKWTPPKAAAFAEPVDLKAPHIAELLQMHTYRRPGGSATEQKLINTYLNLKGAKRDGYGNVIVRVGTNPRVLWSSHTDTVHRTEGRQKLEYGDGFLTISSKEKVRECLGADCTVGVWIMRQMILRKIPGLYIFHREEETGGGGSRFIAKETPHVLKDIDYAIAFDRFGTNSIITHQGTRCASDAFGTALAKALNTPGNFDLDDSGTFTDTRNYTDDIRECTNISVGYYSQHTANERLDVAFADHLLNRICALDVTALPVVREVTDNEYAYSGYSSTDYTSYFTKRYTSHNSGSKYTSRRSSLHNRVDLTTFCETYPHLVARFLNEEGFSVSDIEDFDLFNPEEEGERGFLDLTREVEEDEE